MVADLAEVTAFAAIYLGTGGFVTPLASVEMFLMFVRALVIAMPAALASVYLIIRRRTVIIRHRTVVSTVDAVAAVMPNLFLPAMCLWLLDPVAVPREVFEITASSSFRNSAVSNIRLPATDRASRIVLRFGFARSRPSFTGRLSLPASYPTRTRPHRWERFSSVTRPSVWAT
jgi:hypothetical protein